MNVINMLPFPVGFKSILTVHNHPLSYLFRYALWWLYDAAKQIRT